MFWKKNRDEKPAEEAARVSETKEATTPVDTNAASTSNSAAPELTSTSSSAAPSASLETAASPAAPLETGAMRERVIEQLRTVFDPEIPVNIHELGLVYKIDVDEAGHVKIEMTLTSPACPSAAEIPLDVKHKVGSIDGVKSVDVEIVWDPPWTMEFMSEAARVTLGFY